jgi:uncharacterized protein
MFSARGRARADGGDPRGGHRLLAFLSAGPVQVCAGGGERREQKSLTQERELRARIHVITLAVSDLDAALEFYRDGLGLNSPGVIGTEFTGDDTNPAGAAAMFELEGGLILALYPRTELAKDANIPLGPPKTGEFSIGHAVASKEEVDTLLVRADEAGATLTVPGHDRPWGIYAGYFRDLDGHLWEIMWNPRLDIDGPS